MSSAPSIRAWQLGPVTRLGLVSAVALFTLAVDSVFVWSATPNRLVSAAFVVIPFLVGVRVARGFDRSLLAALWTFAGAIALAAGHLRSPVPAPSSVTASAVALLLSAVGIAASIAAVLERGAPPTTPVIAISRDRSGDTLARVSSR